MSAPRAPRSVTHAPAAKPKPAAAGAPRRCAVPAGAGADVDSAPAWASSPAPPFGLAAPVGFQRKPVIGPPDDAYEREADRVADRVATGRPAAAPVSLSRLNGAPAYPVRRKSAGDRTEHDDPPRADGGGPGILQRATAGDRSERGGQARSRSSLPAALLKRASALLTRAGDDDPEGASAPVQRKERDEARGCGCGACAACGVQRALKPGAFVQRATAGDRTEHDDPPRASASVGPAQGPGEEKGCGCGSCAACRVQRASKEDRWRDGGAEMRDAAARAIASRGLGAPLPPRTRSALEAGMGVDLGAVRVHDGADAHRSTARLHARAFTHGRDIWLGRGESPHDVRLMAHEAAHVVQQGAAGPQPSQAAPAPPQGTIQRIPDWILERLNSYAHHIPGWDLFTVIIGHNPLTGRNVARTARNLLGGLIGLVPSGGAIFDKLEEHGIVDAAFAWVRGQLDRLDLSLGRLERTIEAAWEEVSIPRGWDYNMGVLRRHFGALYDDVVEFASSLVDHVMQLIKEAVIGVAERLLAENRAWALIKKILGYDPLRNQPVQATPVQILEDFLMLIGQEEHLRQMRERGTVQQAANWIATQIATFMTLLGELRGLFTRAWDAIQPANLANLGANLRALAADAGRFLQRVWDFASTVAARVLELIKNALLGWLAGFANDVPGFHLMTVILGRNPFTGEAVPRTAVNLIRGFITLLPGGEGIYARLQETGTITRAAARIEGAVEALGISWEFITGIFRGIWDSLSITALAHPVETFQGIVDRFGEPVSRLFRFVGIVLREIISIVLEMMNFPSDLIGSIISNAMQAIEDIKRDPVQFLLNMLAAVKRGFGRFFDNIVTHLVAGLSDWLFRGLRQAGIQPPADFSLRSVLDFVLQVLGISMDRIWEKLGRRIGPERVARIRGAIDRLTGIWNFVRDVQQRGIAAVWEYIRSQISGLWDMVLQKAKDWVMERVIARGMQWLMSLLDVTGIMPVINGFRAFFSAVQSAIEYLRDILAIINDYVSTLAAVARGEIEPGAQKIERGLANAIPVAIGFLANQFGLGNIGEKIQEIVGGIREVVDRALDWLIDRAVSTVQSLLASLGIGREQAAPGAAPPGAHDVDQNVTVGGERHMIRAHIGSDGSFQLLMASGTLGAIVSRLGEIEAYYMAYFNTHNMTGLRDLLTEDMAKLRTKVTEIQGRVDAVPPGTNARDRNAADRQKQAVAQQGVTEIVGMLNALAGSYQFGVGASAAVNDDVISKAGDPRNTTLIKVSEVGVLVDPVWHPLDRRERDAQVHFGIRTVNATGQFVRALAYYQYGRTWELPKLTGGTAKPGPVEVYPGGTAVRKKTVETPLNTADTDPRVDPAGLDDVFTDRGHLIANRFFGSNTNPNNIAAMSVRANRSLMKRLENQLAAKVTNGAGFVYELEVNPDADPRVRPPTNIHFKANRVFPGVVPGDVEGDVPNP